MSAAAPQEATIYTASRLFVDSETVVSPGALGVVDGVVVAAGSPAAVAATVPAGSKRVDCPGAAIVPGLVVRAYGPTFAARLGLSRAAADGILRAGESDFQAFMTGYGALLAVGDRATIVGALAQQGAARLHAYVLALTGLDVTVPPANLASVLNAAFLVAGDYGPALDATLGLLRRDMELRVRDIE